MATATPIPHQLRSRPFTGAQARAYGLSPRMLEGNRIVPMFRGVYRCADLVPTLHAWLQAALLVLPADAAVSHVSALWTYGVEIGKRWPLHFSTNSPATTRRAGIRLHRRRGDLHPRQRCGLRVLGPDRTFVDAATELNIIELIQAGDWLLHLKRTDLEALQAYAWRSHLDGVLRARRALTWVRERVESPMETLLRLMIVFARLPEPDTNRDIFDTMGRFIARGDMPYLDYSVLVEYDGEWHERSPRQRQRDRERREQLRDNGWRVIVVLAEDLADKPAIVWRVYNELRARGYEGRHPHFNAMWTKWFA